MIEYDYVTILSIVLAVASIAFIYIFRKQIAEFLTSADIKMLYPKIIPLIKDFKDLVEELSDSLEDGKITFEEALRIQAEVTDILEKLLNINSEISEK